MRKQKLNKRGNIDLRNFLEFSSSSVLKTVGDVTIMKEVITPSRSAFSNNANSMYIHFKFDYSISSIVEKKRLKDEKLEIVLCSHGVFFFAIDDLP